MEKDICTLKHENIDKHLAINDKRLNSHGERLDKLEIGQMRTDTIVENLCEQIKSLVSAIKGLIGVTISVLLGFFIWYIQSIPR